jgi:hypothetical protein
MNNVFKIKRGEGIKRLEKTAERGASYPCSSPNIVKKIEVRKMR